MSYLLLPLDTSKSRLLRGSGLADAESVSNSFITNRYAAAGGTVLAPVCMSASACRSWLWDLSACLEWKKRPPTVHITFGPISVNHKASCRAGVSTSGVIGLGFTGPIETALVVLRAQPGEVWKWGLSCMKDSRTW